MRAVLGFILVSFIIFVFMAVVLFGQQLAYAKETIAVELIPTPRPTPIPIVINNPQRLIIPKLNIDAPVEAIGMATDTRMAVPEKDADVGWYKLGYKIGQRGNAVLAGHYDDIQGQPAIFYHLANLAIGDEIRVQGEGKELKFKVINVAIYPYNDFPEEQLFGKSDKAHLNLITCDGVFDQNSQNYLQRRVVFAEEIS